MPNSAGRSPEGESSHKHPKCSDACVSMLLQFHGAWKHGGKIRALLKRSFFLTKPLILGIGASKVLPRK